MLWVAGGVLVLLAVVVIYDLTQTHHAILRNFPIIGHFRYILEGVGPELRQYIVTDNDSERPFSRDQRRWVYASSKQENNYFGFGTDNNLEAFRDYLIVKQSAFPIRADKDQPGYPIPCAKILGAARDRRLQFRPQSIVNISGMSYGSLSAAAVEALNRGAKLAGCLQNTGEGSIAPYHNHGGELIWQIGTGYFGCRDASGNFDMARFKARVEQYPVRAIEIKLSQGAKPGLGGMLPAAKITQEIATIRDIPLGKDCLSPNAHSAFHDVDSMLDFVEQIADETGLPVGIKSAVGDLGFWVTLAEQMHSTGRGVDFINIDGGEGGTGAAPLVFSDHVALPFRVGFARVYSVFAERGVHESVVFGGAGKLGFPETAILAMALGCDWLHIGREAMLAIGCIQAQRCHTGHCPTGVATQNKWLMHGLEPESKSARLANYIVTLRKEILQLTRAAGRHHPALLMADQIELLENGLYGRTAQEVFNYRNGWGRPCDGDCDDIVQLIAPTSKTKIPEQVQ